MNEHPHTFTYMPSQNEVRHLPIKRVFDILFSLFFLAVGLPLFFLIFLIVRFSSKGPVIYGHKRIGRGGVPFYCYKFRTMYADADQRLHDLLENDPTLKAEWEAAHKLRNDPRITPIGAFLRKTSLDELPQLWNVLKGDLSLVGPRPVVEAELRKFYGEKAEKILTIRPGVTGLWQISGRNDIDYAERVALDEHYVDSRRLSTDFKILALTLPVLLFRKGAY